MNSGFFVALIKIFGRVKSGLRTCPAPLRSAISPVELIKFYLVIEIHTVLAPGLGFHLPMLGHVVAQGE
jgi:hypothetical protein